MPDATPHPLDLPEPEAGDQQTSAELSNRIREAIHAAGGSIGFDAYMEQALYTPGLGYYSSARTRFGPAGDFVTAPEISSLFSQCLARQALEVFAALGPNSRRILEAGAGSGIMARDLITALDGLGESLDGYFILERSAGARAQQRHTLGPLAERVQWLNDFPVGGFRGLVTGNELLDAFPAVRFIIGESGPEELRVACQEDGLCWRQELFADDRILRDLNGRLAECGDLAVGYASEFAPAQAAWVRSLADHLQAGVILLFDYGYPRREFYHPQRERGTLACHYRHRMHEDPFRYPGLQDISVHVDFTAIAETAVAAGLSVLGYTSQANFLIAGGLLDIVSHETASNPRQQAVLSAQIQRLTLASQLGEAVKVMALSPDPDIQLSGFSGRDLSSRL